MKKLMLLCVLSVVCSALFAQATDLVVDCQTPGWLSSKINYGDQQTVKNLKVIGYINSTDLKFIGSLVNNQHLDGMLNLSECVIVNTNTGEVDNVFDGLALEKKDTLKCFRIPKSATSVSKCTHLLRCDTLYFDCQMKYANKECLDEESTDIDYLYLGEIIDSIPASAFTNCKINMIEGGENIRYIGNSAFNSLPLKNFKFSETLKYIGNGAFGGHKMKEIVLPDSMDVIGSYAFTVSLFEDTINYVKLPQNLRVLGAEAFPTYCPDTVSIPLGVETVHLTSFLRKDGQVWVLPESVITLDNGEHGQIGLKEKLSFYLFSQHVVKISKRDCGIVTYKSSPTASMQDAIEAAAKELTNWTVYVPKGMITEYHNSDYWYNTYTNSDRTYIYYHVDSYWFNANFVEIVNKVTGVTLDKEYLEFSKIGEVGYLTAFVEPINADNKAVRWESMNNNVCIVSSEGQVVSTGEGTTNIVCITEDGGFTARCIVKVVQHVTKVEVSKSDISLKVGESEHLTATVSPANVENKNLVWSTSNNQVATVDANGNVQALKAGEAWIKAVSVDNTEAKDSCKLTVIQPVTGITISQPTIQFTNIGENIQLEATVLPEDASNKEVTWTSSNESVCMVANGMVVATGYGTAVVMSITKDGGFMASCSVIVEKETIPVTGITLSQTSATLKKGETLQLEATVTPDDATNKTLIWKSSDETKCVVTQSGLLVALTEGQAIITVIPENGVGQAQCNVLIVDEGSSISTVSVDASKSEMPIYDIMGQRVLHLMKGHLYICNGKKFIAK